MACSPPAVDRSRHGANAFRRPSTRAGADVPVDQVPVFLLGTFTMSPLSHHTKRERYLQSLLVFVRLPCSSRPVAGFRPAPPAPAAPNLFQEAHVASVMRQQVR